jgi:hypothetical protein
MRLTFNEYIEQRNYEAEMLAEKQIMYSGKKYGQIVFLAGGAGSGKGFAISNYMPGSDFKIRDVDELKIAFQKLDQLGKFTLDDLLAKYGDSMPESDKNFIQTKVIDKGFSLKDLNLKTPEHVFALHALVRATGAKDKTLNLILDNAVQGRLPNILFDSTFADMSDINAYVPRLVELGYDSKDIHITWVLTNYEIAIKNNMARARVVPDDIMLKTHTGAAKTILSLVKSGLPSNIDGGFYVILNNPENTVYVVDPKTGEHYVNLSKAGKARKVIAGFTYITMKKPGKALTTDADVKSQLFAWVKDNVPADAINADDMKL